jgi:hypothetical protein
VSDLTDSATPVVGRFQRPKRIRSRTLGDTRVTFVPDGVIRLVARNWLPDLTDEE